MIIIIDYDAGNIHSVQHACSHCGYDSQITQSPDLIASATGIIIPGQGAFKPAMEKMNQRNILPSLQQAINNKIPILGICLGFQIMSSFSQEDGGIEGLSLIDAEVKRLENSTSHNEWEPFSFRKDQMNGQSFSSSQKLSRKTILDGRVFYNHEYGVINNDPYAFTVPVSLKLNQYSGMFVKDKIIGIQFHPEKSQLTGLELISMIL